MSGTQTRIGLRDRFVRVLTHAAQERKQRDEFVTLGDGRHELGWVLHERELMLSAVNTARAERGVGPVDRSLVERVERQAEGHIDYAAKFAIGCAELVLDQSWCQRGPSGVVPAGGCPVTRRHPDTPMNTDLAMDLLTEQRDRARARLAATTAAHAELVDAAAAVVSRLHTGPVPHTMRTRLERAVKTIRSAS